MSVPHISRRRMLLGAGAGAGAAGLAATGVGLASSALAARPQASPTLMTGYVEVNSHSVGNVAKYELDGGGNVFDIGLIFAANINYDGQQAYLYNNPQVQAQLDGADTHIRPAQAKGIKILLSVLGNHQGAGFANFPDRAAAEAFADQLADVVNRYGLDGIDFDDEWADYGANGTGQPNDFSFVYLVQALRERIPDKLITLYYIGPTASRLSYGGVNAGDLLDHSWNPYYGTWGVPDVPGLGKAELAPAAIDIQGTPSSTAVSLASQTVSEGYGVFNTYNLGSADASGYLSEVTRKLYGKATLYTG
ncbi:glycosyl hydrolase family 18 (putative chitinase) [Nocardioides albertanoniae]|uniref:Glycosyl hydrolase family 18 (Putative chitinase) n=1 Tax=Nocardioides albertanoniae TaxID=1175486 RepID=A0A543A5E7_9ACTN|nr:endo-beta-N-acetylglucosaminidase H [Nocardioides albertanoniae]TQL67823.1 glycosyl hydrolase family 18 (putative chitinase) [Nocardioides albertanoniae]